MEQLQQDIEHGAHTSQSSSDVIAETMADRLQITDDRDHGPSSLNKHTFIPIAFLAQFQAGGHPILVTEAIIGKDDAGFSNGFGYRMEMLVVRIHRVPVPRRADTCSATHTA